MTELGTAYITVMPDMSRFNRGVRVTDVGASIGESVGGEMASSLTDGLSTKKLALGNFLGNLGSSVFDAVLGAISRNLGAAIQRLDTIKNYTKVMQSLGYSAEDAATSIGKIQKALDGLPTSTDAMIDSVQKIAPITGSLESATDIALALNNALLAGGKSTQMQANAMEQYSQMLAAGKVDAQSWSSLVNAMYGQLDQVAKKLLGANANQQTLYDAMKKGTITFDDFNNALLELNTQGLDGLQSFQDQAKAATQGIGTALENVQNRIARAIADVLDAIGQENIAGVINAFSSSFAVISGVVVAIINVIKSALSGLYNAAIKPVMDAVGEVIAAHGPQITSFMEKASSMVQKLWGALSALGQALFDIIGDAVKPMIPVITAVIDAILTYVVPALGVVFDVLGKVFDLIAQYARPIVEIVMLLNGGLIPILTLLFSHISDIGTVVSTVVQFISQKISAVVTTVINMKNKVVSTISALKARVTSIFNAVKNAITNPIETAKNTVKRIIDTIKGFFTGFHVSLPHVKLPHFSISPAGWKVSDLLQGKIPKLGIEWYAKGGFVNGATLIGAGEAGGEGIVPLEGRHMRPMAYEISKQLNFAAQVTEWLDKNLGPTIEAYAPTATPREFGRMVRQYA